MTMGGMGFIPERLLMMLMMMMIYIYISSLKGGQLRWFVIFMILHTIYYYVYYYIYYITGTVYISSYAAQRVAVFALPLSPPRP